MSFLNCLPAYPIVQSLESRTLFNAGFVDPSFSFQASASNFGVITDVAADANGKILISGSPTAIGEVGLQRLLPGGGIDTRFGTGGQLNFNFVPKTDSTVIRAVAVQPDGRIVIAGSYGVGVGNDYFFYSTTQTPFVARLCPSGTLDKTFGTGGRIVGAAFNDVAGIAVLPSGKIIFGGDNGYLNGGSIFQAVRLNADGTVDKTYGVNGRASLAAHDIANPRTFNVESDGKLVLGGRDIARFTAAGLPDPTFGSGGDIAPTYPMFGSIVTSAPQGNHKILVEFYGGNEQDMLERLNDNGTLDRSFGFNGIAATPYLGYDGGAIAFDSAGRILLAGAGASSLSVTRYEPNGAIDKSFGVNGSSSTGGATGAIQSAAAITLQSSGRIVIVGSEPAASVNNTYPLAIPLATRILGSHVVLTAGTSAVTTGASLVADPRLLGSVIANQTLNFTFGSGASAVSGNVQEYVVKETVAGTLDFYFRIATAAGSAVGISSLLASNFAGFQTYVDYRPDSKGTIAPVTAGRSTDDTSIVFNFLPIPAGDGLASAGTLSYSLLVKTDATHFNKLGKVVLNSTIDLDGYEPIG